MTIHRAVGHSGTLYEIRDLRLFIDGDEAIRTDGKPWESLDDAQNAADSAEIDESGACLPVSAWQLASVSG